MLANFSYQGILKNADGTPLMGSHNLLFKIYETETGGTEIWQENHVGVELDNGIFSVTLENLSSLTFDQQYWLAIILDGGAELEPRTELTAVPYALMTKSISNNSVTTDKIVNNQVTPEKINTTGASDGDALIFDGTNLNWQTSQGGGLILPYTSTYSGGNTAFRITSTGTGDIARFIIDNPANNGHALYLKTNGQQQALWISNNGSDDAVAISNNYGHAIDINNNSIQDALRVRQFGTDNCAYFTIDNPSNSKDVIYAVTNGSGRAGFFGGDVFISGALSVGGAKNFLIDHPLDPENKILRHSCIEGPEMMNIYKGRSKLKNGKVEIILPEYFDALNHPEGREINLTPINGWSPLFLEGKIEDNKFVIKTTNSGNPEQEFSWIIYTVRNDEFAKKHPLIVEEVKGINNRYQKGKYINPDIWGEKLLSESKNNSNSVQEY